LFINQLQHSGDGHLVDGSGDMPVTMDVNSLTQAGIGNEGHIILTGEDGQQYPVSLSGMITVPMPQNIYQTVVANISSIQNQQIQGSDGTLQVLFA
jgi:nuclear respiratory factor 1